MLLTIARYWLAFLALFELPAIYSHLVAGGKVGGFFGKLQNAGPERRLWSMVLVLLVVSRAIAALHPTPASLAHCSAVHITEAVFFGAEHVISNGKGADSIILGVIVFNAIFFTHVAMTVD